MDTINAAGKYLVWSGVTFFSAFGCLDRIAAQEFGQQDIIAYVSDGKQAQISVMDSSGNKLEDLALPKGRYLHPVWSPDGESLAFTGDNGTSPDIYVYATRTKKVYRVTDWPSEEHSPAWSPDGKKIAFATNRDGDWEIYVLDLQSKNETNITQNSADDSLPAWSPDGNWIAFMSDRTKNPDGSNNLDIWLTRPDGTGVRRVTTDAAYDFSPAWFPDSRYLAFVSTRAGNRDIFSIATDGSDQQNLIRHTAEDYTPTVSPDGSQIIFASNRDGNSELYKTDAQGTLVERLTQTPDIGESYPNWRPPRNDRDMAQKVSERQTMPQIWGQLKRKY